MCLITWKNMRRAGVWVYFIFLSAIFVREVWWRKAKKTLSLAYPNLFVILPGKYRAHVFTPERKPNERTAMPRRDAGNGKNETNRGLPAVLYNRNDAVDGIN